MDDIDRQMQQMLLDDAILHSGIEGCSIVESFKSILSLVFPERSDDSLRAVLRTQLIAAHRREPFLLNEEAVIPHVPYGIEPRIAWLRSPTGLSDENDPAVSAKIIFFAVAPENILKHVMAFACQMIRDPQFRRDFIDATTARAFRLSLSAAFERQITRTVDTAAILEKRAKAVLESYYDRKESQAETHIDYLFVANKRGLHARFSARVVQCVEAHDCDTVVFSAHGTSVGGASIMGLMMLSLPLGRIVEVVIQGRQAKELGSRLSQLFADEIQVDLSDDVRTRLPKSSE